MFEPLPAQFNFPEAELRVLEFWQKHDVFGKSLEIRRNAPRFVFYEGPPTANGLPHPGHCLTRAIKDLFPRYQTMCGKLVERKAGWDTHGLPVEIEVCKQLGIHTKEEIEAHGLDKFVRLCIESVFKYVREWEEMTRRLGFWVNLEEAYVTYHQSYVESVWWGLKTLFKRGLLYQGHKVVWWWAQGGTALSAGEVGEGYRTVDDPSVYIRFPLVAEGTEARRQSEPEAQARVNLPPGMPPEAADKTSLLVWTTTPWTLISNHFAAVGPDVDYSLVHDKTGDEYFYIATALVNTVAEKLKHEFEPIATCKGTDLVGLRYTPPFDCYHESMKNRTAALKAGGEAHIAWRVLLADFVTLDSGTGLVHEAPAYGEVDFDLLQQERQRFADFDAIPLINAVAPNGTFTDEAPEKYRGRWVKDCDRDIIRELRERGVLLHDEVVRHEYPFCPRSEDDPLIQYARKSWFVRTSQFKDEFLKNNEGVYWLPEHIRGGRFGDFLRNNVDWALSRERYWGTPLPIWVCEQTGQMEAIGSYAELLDKPGVTGTEVWEQAKRETPDLPEHLKVHKPYIDAITYDSPFAKSEPGAEATGQKPRMRRVPEVIDCWWDAGSMPFAQWGFPHAEGSIKTFTERFPADFISEAIDQTRGWFYGLLAISTLLFSKGGPGVPPGEEKGGPGVPPGVRSPGAARRPVTEDLTIRRRKLPHWEAGGSTYFVTFRAARHSQAARLRADEPLSPDERTITLKACQHWDGQRILLHAAAVMPDHVHLLFTPLEKRPGEWWSLAELMHSIKGYTAKEIAELRSVELGHGTSEAVWQEEYYDRIIRNEADFAEKWQYIVENAERAGFSDVYPWLWVEPSHADTDGGRDARPTPAIERAYPHPYKACIVLGHVMGEDALKMSKRTKNYREPSYIFDQYGADAMRWYFLSAQVPWTSIRFQEAAIRDAQREFLIRLYNVFSFFNIYANIDEFSVGPVSDRSEATGQRPVPHATGHRPVAERSELDRWIISELNRTIQTVRNHLDRFENYPAASRINEFVDALSNWYVRRSRARFWRSEKNQDKWDAYNTLYEALFALSKLIAPFTPFMAETMYQNLIGTKGPRDRGTEGEDVAAGVSPAVDEPISVHLCDYPTADEGLIDESLAQEMDLVRQIVSLGRAARTEAKLKVRQPLEQVEIILVHSEHTEWLASHADLIAEELNIKRVEFSTEADHYVTYQVKPNFKALGPKFGKIAPQIAGALGKLDAAEARKVLSATGELALEVGGQQLRLTSDDVQIRLEAKPGWSASQGRAGVVVVKTELSPELKEEGLIRELIHHVQGMRRDKDLAYEARIVLYIEGPTEFLEIVRRFVPIIQRECLVERLEFSAPPTGETATARIESHQVRLAIETT